MHSFLKEETIDLRQQITFVGNEMKIYLPEYFFEKGSIYGTVYGNLIETIGLFWFKVDGKKYELTLPLKIRFSFTSEEKFRGKIIPEMPTDSYKVFTLKKGDAFVYDTNHVEDISDLELGILKLINGAKMPATVSYSEVMNILLQLLVASGVKTKLPVSSSIFEIIFSELYRNKHNPSEPFRALVNKSQHTSDYDFKMMKLTKVSQMNSVFNSLLSEDVYTQLANCVVRTKEHQKDRISPMEKLLKK